MANIVRQFKYNINPDEVETVTLYEKIVGFFSTHSEYWVEDSYDLSKSSLMKTRKEADYEFEKRCYFNFSSYEVQEKVQLYGDELAELFPLFCRQSGRLIYFNPERRDFLVVCHYLQWDNRKEFQSKVEDISRRIGKNIEIRNVESNVFYSLTWEIRPDSAKLYKELYQVEDCSKFLYSRILDISHFLEKEFIYSYPKPWDLFRSIELIGNFF